MERQTPRGALSRRDLLLGTLAAATVTQAGCGGSGGGSIGNGPFDVAVIGGGVAGLAAAKSLQAAGRKVVVLEAKNRSGGRTWSDNTTFKAQEVSFDVGGQWFHQADTNALLPIAKSKFYPVIKDPHTKIGFNGTTMVPQSTIDALDSSNQNAAAAIAIAGAAVTAGAPDFDVATATAGLSADPWYWLTRAMLGRLVVTADFDKVGVLDSFNMLLHAGEPDYLIKSGMGNFIQDQFGKGAPVQLISAVRTIHWGDPSGVRIDSSMGTVSAKAVVVTVPIGVLQAGGIQFDPPLPAEYQTAIHGLSMGNLEKIALMFDKNIYPPEIQPAYSLVPNMAPGVDRPDQCLFVCRLWGSNLTVCVIGGEHAKSLSPGGQPAMVDFALTTLSGMFGSQVRRSFISSRTSAWTADPFTLGSYTYAKPGGEGGRTQLGVPLANRVFFAGEALSIHSARMINGAYETGLAAATKVNAVL